MRTMIGRCMAAMVVAAIVMLAALASPVTAKAQLCPSVTVINNSGCDLSLQFIDAAGHDIPPAYHLPPGGSVLMPAGPTPAAGIRTKNKQAVFYPAGGGCSPCAQLPGWNGAQGCCVTLCPNLATCTMTVTLCGPPCTL